MSTIAFRKTTIACAILAVAALSGCDANGPGFGGAGGGPNGNGTGPVTGGSGGTGSTFPNNGTASTTITNGGTAVNGHFICTESAQSQYGTTTYYSVNGVVGTLTAPLNSLGANTATGLLNAVNNADLAIDGNLDTYSTFALTAGALGAVDTVTQTVQLPPNSTVAPGGYAVFAVQFPAGTVTAAVLGNVIVTTYLNKVAQETITVSETQIALIGANVAGVTNAFIGVQATKPYDRADISLTPPVVSADVGDAMQVDELCTSGNIITP
ncbi:MAG: hypothetical protein ACRESS_05995 [Stenotrophobium sp.]